VELLKVTVSLSKSTTDADVFLRSMVIIGTLFDGNRHLKSLPIVADIKPLLERQGSSELGEVLTVVKAQLS
jgi:hypothetical protein